ncbi:hypothetical protein AB4238_12735, partial [Shewanella sp. 10N.286.45.A1]
MKKIINGLVASVAFACSLPVMASSHTSIDNFDSNYLAFDLQTAGVPNIKVKPVLTAGVPNIKVKPVLTAGVPNIKVRPVLTAGVPNIKV